MTETSEAAYVPALKDGETQRAVPSAWRARLRDIVKAFIRGDFQLGTDVDGVAPIAAATAHQIRDYIQQYDATLIELPDDTWDTSVSVWMGDHWDVLIDLWTASEGRSDLVLHARVHESGGEHRIHVYMVYVP